MNNLYLKWRISPWGKPYIDVVLGLAWSYDFESYAGGILLLVVSPMPDSLKVMTRTKEMT